MSKAFSKSAAFVALFDGHLRVEHRRGAKIATQRAVLGVLIARATDSGDVPPARAPRVQDLVDILGVSERSARASVAALRAQGIIRTVDRAGKQRGFELCFPIDTPCKNDSPSVFAGGTSSQSSETPPAKTIVLAETPVVNGETTCKNATPGETAPPANSPPLSFLQGVPIDAATDPDRRAVARTVLSPSNAVGWEIWEVLVRCSPLRAAEDADHGPKPGSLARMAKGISDMIGRRSSTIEATRGAIEAVARDVEALPELPTMEEISQLFSRHLRPIRRGASAAQERP